MRTWLPLVTVTALAGAMAITAIARGDAPTVADRVAALVPRYGSKSVPLVDATEFGAAVDTACNHDRDCAARLVTMAVLESGLSLSVSRSEYTEHQGDSYKDRDGVIQHRAWGTWQQHRNAHNADVWGASDLLTQARAAKAAQAGALVECKAFREVPPEVGMWRILAGRGCTGMWGGVEKRMQLLAQVRRRL